jgi:hypothetical protein
MMYIPTPHYNAVKELVKPTVYNSAVWTSELDTYKLKSTVSWSKTIKTPYIRFKFIPSLKTCRRLNRMQFSCEWPFPYKTCISKFSPIVGLSMRTLL